MKNIRNIFFKGLPLNHKKKKKKIVKSAKKYLDTSKLRSSQNNIKIEIYTHLSTLPFITLSGPVLSQSLHQTILNYFSL